MELFIYLAKVSGCMAALYLVYHIVFRNLTFFTLNRFFLLSALGISLIIPLLHIGITTTLPAPDVRPVIVDTAATTIQSVVDLAPSVTIQQQPQHHTNWLLIATAAYGAIAALLLIKLLVVMGGILYKAFKYGERQNGYRLINGRSANNSSFFRCLFLNADGLDDQEKQQVICHELMHARLLHSIDNLFTEVLKALLWFNPFVYLFSKALHQAHEFEVDKNLALQYNSKKYAGLLLKLSHPAMAGISNQFSAYGLKTRIQMLFGTRSAAAKKLSYLLAVPVIAGLVYFLAVQRVYAIADVKASDKDFVLVLDAGHGDNSGARVGNIFESDINLAMVKQIKAIAEEHGIKTILTRSDNTDVPLDKRTSTQGDAFVSIHVNAVAGEQSNNASGMLVITGRTDTQPASQKLANAFIDEMKKLKGMTISDKIYHQGIKVLQENKMPGILLELGYLTNKSDLKYLIDPQNQHEIAQKFVDAIIAYKSTIATKTGSIHRMVDSAVRTDVKVNLTGNILRRTIAQSIINDTIIKVKPANEISANNLHGGHISMLNIMYTNGNPNESKDNLFKEFNNYRINSADSTKFDSKANMIQLYNAELNTGRFNIKADHIVYDLRDSLISANGNVCIKVSDRKNANAAPTILYTDSLHVMLNKLNYRPLIRRLIDNKLNDNIPKKF